MQHGLKVVQFPWPIVRNEHEFVAIHSFSELDVSFLLFHGNKVSIDCSDFRIK